MQESFICKNLIGYVFEGTQNGKPCFMVKMFINGNWETLCFEKEG